MKLVRSLGSVPRLVPAAVLAYVAWTLWRSGDVQEVLRFGVVLVMALPPVAFGKRSAASRFFRVMARGTAWAFIGATITMVSDQNWTTVFTIYGGLLVIGILVAMIMTAPKSPPKAKAPTH